MVAWVRSASATAWLLSGTAVAAPADHAGRVLVILSAKSEPGHVPDGLARAEALPGVQIERLESSRFSNLMPCFELVVAGSRATVAEARALGTALAEAGVEHTLKPAGRWVGRNPPIEQYCAAQRSGSPSAESQPVVFGGALGVPVPVPGAVASRAIGELPPLHARSDESWAAPLPVRTVGAWSVGKPIAAWRYDAGPIECLVTGFEVGVEGTPHFGWRAAGLAAPPPCGSEELIATLSCEPHVAMMSTSAAAATVGVWQGDWVATPDPGAFPETPALLAELEAATDGDPVRRKPSVSWTRRQLRMGDETWTVFELIRYTGEGAWWCGGEDYFGRHVGLLRSDGAVLLPLQDITNYELIGIFALPGEPTPRLHLREIITGSQRAVGPGLPEIAQHRGYCDCPC